MIRKLLLLIFLSVFLYTGYCEDLIIFGNKNFNYKNLSLDGDFTRFFSENPDLKKGTSIEQSLKLRIMGDISPGIGINAVFDDTKVQNDNREITLYLKGNGLEGSVGDILTSFNFSDLIIFNKKTQGFEIKDKKNSFYFLYADSEGKINSEVLTGQGNQQEYVLAFYPLIKGSETIIIDGKKLTRGTDYEIDYEDGTIFFENTVLPIESDKNIFINYQYEEDEKVYKRKIWGAGYKAYLLNDRLNLGFGYFEDSDSKSKLIEDAPDTIKPSSHKTGSFFLNFSNSIFKLNYERALSKKDNNILSESTLTDKENTSFFNKYSVNFSKGEFDLKYLNIDRDTGYEIIGKKESDIVIEENSGMISYKKNKSKTSFSFENIENTSIVYNDPFLNITGDSPESFDNDRKNIVFGFGNVFDISGSIIKSEKENKNNEFFEENINSYNFVTDYKNGINYNFSIYENTLKEINTGVYSKNMKKKSAGLSFEDYDGNISYLFTDIEDKGNKIKNHDIDSQLYKDKWNAYISMKIREEESKKNRIGDVNLTYDISDEMKVQYRLNSSLLLQYNSTEEINVENTMENYKFDYYDDLFNITYLLNSREKVNNSTDILENKNGMHNLDISYNPFSAYSYQLKFIRIDNKNYINSTVLKDIGMDVNINRNITYNTVLSFSWNGKKKDDTQSLNNNYDIKGYSVGLKKTSSDFEYDINVSLSKKDYFDNRRSDIIEYGNELKYNIDSKTNVKYNFSKKIEDIGDKRDYFEDELSYNRNINMKSYLKVFYKNKDVPEDDSGKAYSYTILGATFDTNF